MELKGCTALKVFVKEKNQLTNFIKFYLQIKKKHTVLSGSMYSYTQPVCPFETLLVMNELIKLQMYVFFIKGKTFARVNIAKKR